MKQILSMVLVAFLSGCSLVSGVSDDQLAADLQTGAKAAVKYSITLALRKYPADQAKITTEAKLADQILTQNIIPIFSGASSQDVLRSAVDQALAQLQSKITDPRISAAIELGTQILIDEVPLPKNPADKLSDRTKKSLAGIFGGISLGIEAALAPAPAPVPPPAPGQIPPPPPK